MRIIFFAGKGGVGKTSVAAATGVKTAEAGHRTVVMSLDVAHSLADIFDLDRGLIDEDRGSLTRIGKNLWIQELDIQEEIEKNWGDIHKYLSTLLNTTGLDEILAEELAILPGMEEVSLLLHINRYVRTKKFDVILLDCAPTGESLRFISIPTTLDWYIKKIFKIEKTVARYARPLAKRLYDVPLPGEDYFDAIEFLFKRLRGVDKILVDPEITTVRLITNPEKIVLKETQRAFMYFSLYKMSIDGIIMNRILPDDAGEAYFKDWRKSQKGYIRQAKAYFSPIPLFPVNLFRGEVLGMDSLRDLADQIYGERDPLNRFFKGEPYSFVKVNGKYQLRVKLPFIGKGDVELNKVSDELIIRVGSFKRHFILPRQVAASDSVKARLDGEFLSVHFGS
ncbi:MAG: ArsA family ATPase [Deltaproteobacteria bacterium]|nr:ArsA family ATPase [Deltaproteobacteria bacterium]MBW2049142.1 ArsA family ATPase [Deltaproteobacteria bacterium]MBW2111673.1 ArsA family ATPase [Deltaproteobacteria bacterium]